MNAAAPKVVIAKISFLMLMNDSHARPKRPVAIRSLSTWRPAASSTQFLDQRADLVPINLGRDRTHLLEHNPRSEEHTSELQSLMRISYAVFCLKNKNTIRQHPQEEHTYK